MARPTLPAAGATGWAATMAAAINDVSDRADQALSGGSSGMVGGVALDSFAGADDDAKLTAAMAYASAQTVKPPILFGNRQYTFSTQRTVYSGLKLVGGFGHGDQQRGANSIPNDIRYNGTGTWWTVGGTTYDVYMGGLCFQGNSGAQFMATGGNVLWTSVFENLGFNLWKHVMGNPTTKMLLTAVQFQGWWNTNNSYNTAYTLGGSDCNLWTEGMLLDSPPTTMTAGAYHLRCDFLEKTNIGPLFVTADQNSGIYITGSENNAQLVFTSGGRCEGRNSTTPCYGSNIRMDGGGVTFRDWEIFYGYANPASSGHTGEGGVITVTGGRALFDGCWYDRATATTESTPWIYQSGGFVRVRNTMTGAKGGTWSTTPGKPRVQSVGGVIDADSSVVVS